MQSLLALSGAIDRLNDRFGRLAEWLVLGACVISAGNATVRYLFKMSSNGWLEIQWYMFGALVFFGASQTLRKNEHVRVDLVYASISERSRLWIDALGFGFCMLPIMVLLTVLSFRFALASWQINEWSNSAGGLVVWPAKAILPTGFALLALQSVSELIKRAAMLRGAARFDTAYEKPLQ